MSRLNISELPLDGVHCRAICEEVGERLRAVLDRDAGELPPRLQALMDRLVALDCQQAPSIVPTMEDIRAWSSAA